MGRLTEYFQYLETPPDKLMDFKFRSAWITIKDEDKKLRRKLKLYNKYEKQQSIYKHRNKRFRFL